MTPFDHQEPGSPFKGICWATLFSIAGLILVLGAAGVWGAYA